MPLFELFRLSKAKLESCQDKGSSRTTGVSSEAEDGIVELVWENGQITRQTLASKSRNSLVSKDMGSGSDSKVDTDTYGPVDAVRNEVPVSMSLNQDSDMVPWLNYPLDEHLQSEYCSDFFPEVSGVPVSEHMHGLTSHMAFPFWHRRNSSNESVTDTQSPSTRNKSSLGEPIPSKIPVDEVANTVGCSTSSFSSLSQYPTSEMLDNVGDSARSSATYQAACGESGRDSTSAGCFTDDRKMQMQDTVLPHNKPGFINFSHFLRPAPSAKANLQNMSMTGNSSFSSTKKTGNTDHGDSASDGAAADSLLVQSTSALNNKKKRQFLPNLLPTKFSGPGLETKVHSEPSAAQSYMAMSIHVSADNDQIACQKVAENPTTKGEDGEKATNVMVASSSVCSGNSLDGPSDDPTRSLKRKHSDNLDSEHSSDDVGEESVDTKRAGPAQLGSGSKRSRSAEVHNLSERRRRDRINEKMRALQELIPNCNKVDKASMLDEAIEYLKTLQLQVQMMSMGGGYYMPPMMLPATGMQPVHAAHIAHFPYMGGGMGIGMGFGLGMPNMNGGFPRGTVVQVPAMHGTQFPGASVHSAMGSRMQPFHLTSQGVPTTMHRAPPSTTPLPTGSVSTSGIKVNDQPKNTL